MLRCVIGGNMNNEMRKTIETYMSDYRDKLITAQGIAERTGYRLGAVQDIIDTLDGKNKTRYSHNDENDGFEQHLVNRRW